MEIYWIIGLGLLIVLSLRVLYLGTHYKVKYFGEVDTVRSVTHSGTTVTNVDVRLRNGSLMLFSMDKKIKLKPYDSCKIVMVGRTKDTSYAKHYLIHNRNVYRAELLNAKQ